MVENDKNLAIATFRFGVISEFVTGVKLTYGEKERLIREKTNRNYEIPFSGRKSISRSAIQQWIVDYKRAGYRIEGLYPKERKDAGASRSIDSAIKVAILDMKRANPHWTVPVIINKLKHNKIIAADTNLPINSIYRMLKNEKFTSENTSAQDRRKFEAEYPNDLWQSDIMHGIKVPDQNKRRKTYLCAIIDDHSRLITHAQFFLSERIESLTTTLRYAILKRGIPQKIYADNGSCYRAISLEQICASLGISLIHARPYKPEGKGKIERFFRNVRTSFMPFCEKQKSLESLNQAFEAWVDEYNNSIHSSTKMTPTERFQKNLKCARPAPPDLMNYFRQVVSRTVRKDRSVQLKNHFYEVPVGLIDKKVELRFHEDDLNKVEVFFNNQSFGFANPVNLQVNSMVIRENSNRNHTIQSGTLFERINDE